MKNIFLVIIIISILFPTTILAKQTLLLRDPDISDDKIAFVYGGMLIGSWFMYKSSHRLSNGVLLLLALIWDGITYSFFYWIPSVPAAIVMIIVHGMGIPVITISRTSIIQKNTPNEYHGRLFSMVHLAVVGMTAMSSALVGILAAGMDVRYVFLIFGSGAVISGLIGLLSKQIRQLN